ncbi:DoxX family membrane protein [Sphingomonas sp. JC676]|uniref:DoxX family membrane protein n=1 Tax=Sphingomonas sp. JC676 TaxID=2768065 RepID=UPI00223BE86D|nr:DoxX family membrane protein [Sphingomonas sp. JC676]
MRAGRTIDTNALPYAAGAIGLAVITFLYRDFALQWQPVPAGIPRRETLVLVSAALLGLGGLLALLPRAGFLRLLLPLQYLVWALALHVPVVVAKPAVGALLGFAETFALATGGMALFLGRRPGNMRTVLRILFGLCPIVFGISHLAYADFTASMVPAWLPHRLYWAYFTGGAHIAAGLAIVSGVAAPLAATLLAVMCGGFVVLLHAPRVVAAPSSRLEWTMLLIALSITGAAWLARGLTQAGRARPFSGR